MTQNEANVCVAATVLVVSDCPVECGKCTAAAAGCNAKTELDLFMKYEKEAPEAVAEPMVGHKSSLVMAGVVLVGVAAFAKRARARVGRGMYSDVMLAEEDLATQA